MACPYFYPVEPLEDAAWRPAHLPLGDAYRGECRASGDPYRPGSEELKTLCNMGYGRGRCSRFAGGPDAARFLIVRDTGAGIVISYALERDHLPLEHGRLVYDPAVGSFVTPQGGANIRQQAGAYVRAYLRRKASSKFKTMCSGRH